MNQVEKVKELCRLNRIPLYKLERELGFSNGYIGQLKKGTIPADRLQKIADYFGVTIGYFLGTEEQKPEKQQYYIDQDAADIAQEIFENPELRALFHAAKGVDKQSLLLTAGLLTSMKRTNPDG